MDPDSRIAATARSRSLVSRDVSSSAGEILVGMLELTNLFSDAISLAGADEIKSNADVVVMITLRIEGPRRPSELIGPTHLTSGGLTNLVDRLCGVGLVRRRDADGDDRRAVLIELTPDGVEMLDRLARAVGSALRLAAPLLERWRDLFIAADIEVGKVPNPGGPPLRRLDQMRRLGAAGRRVFVAWSDVFGLDDPKPNHTVHALWLASKPLGTRPRTISEVTGMSSATTTDLLDRLEQRGLIVRLSDESDGRAVVIRPTEAGRSALEQAIRAATPLLPELAAAFLPT